MKKLFILLFIAGTIFITGCQKKEIVVPDEYVGVWILRDASYSFIKINKDGTFKIRSGSEIYEGAVKTGRNEIIIPYSEKLYCGPVGEFETLEEMKLVFPSKKDAHLKLDPDYKDSDSSRSLKNECNTFPLRD